MVTDIFLWVLLPLSGSSTHEISGLASWHGRVMVLCWGVLLPLGILMARFFKVMPSQDWPNKLDNKVWWKSHLAGQGFAVLLAAVGVALVWSTAKGATPLALWHGYAGWVVTALGIAQAIAGFVRGTKGGELDVSIRGDHYDMTPRRRLFEKTHKTLGYVALLLAVVTVCLGLVVSDAPRWMVLLISCWWLLLIAGFVLLQKQGRCVDTYQAIWGPDAVHPGNNIPPIGWGVTRYTSASFALKFRRKKDKS